MSITPMLNATKIQNICLSVEGQQKIGAFVKTMNSQGVTQMFIDFSKVEALIKQMISDNIFSNDPRLLKEFSAEAQEKVFTEFLTQKIIKYLSAVKTLNEMPEHHGFPMFEEFLEFYLPNPMRPITVFFWINEYAIPFKEKFEQYITFHFAFKRNVAQRVSEYKKLLEQAFPLGVEPVVKSLSWVYSNQKKYEKIDFSEIFSHIPFDRYYSELFENEPSSQDKMNSNPEMDRFSFVSKEEIHHLTDEAFKPMILDVIFNNIQSRKLEDINKEIKKLFAERPMFVYQQYSRAIFSVKASELNRVQQEFMKFFDENNIPYETTPNNPLDTLMFMDIPEGSLPS